MDKECWGACFAECVDIHILKTSSDQSQPTVSHWKLAVSQLHFPVYFFVTTTVLAIRPVEHPLFVSVILGQIPCHFLGMRFYSSSGLNR